MAIRLKALRDKYGLNQEGIAASVGMKQSTWSDWEKKPPESFDHLARLVERYQTSADYLLGLTDDPSRREGAAPPSYVVEILKELPKLSDARRYELWKIAEALVAVELAQPSSLDQAIAKATGKVKDEPRIIGGTE